MRGHRPVHFVEGREDAVRGAELGGHAWALVDGDGWAFTEA